MAQKRPEKNPRLKVSVNLWIVLRGDDDFEGESGSSCESESNANDSLYIPTPIREKKARPIDLPNKLGFIALPQLGKFLEMMNEVCGCKTPGCKGNSVSVHVHSQGLGGTFSITCCCVP